MLNQLIYTRCSPYRDLKKRGITVRGDGFGVFSLSPELLDDPQIPNFDFLQQRLSVKNGANEESPAGLFDSYEYFAVSPERYGLAFEHARPHCLIPRKNGRSHRNGTYIKQCLVGQLEGYPYEWFGCDTWTAHLKTENDYYLDDPGNPEAPFLPRVSPAVRNGTIRPEDIKSFVEDGRQDAVKAAVWFLIQEFSKPESERRVLLIKDTSGNVALWVAAVELAFSAEMARTITFATNRSKLGSQTENALFYYTDANGRFSPIQNRSIQQTRHPYSMIVGYHPQDPLCATLKPAAGEHYVLLDGTTKTAHFPTDASIRAAYYDAVVRYGEDIFRFCREILPALPLRGISSEIPKLYDAYAYLLGASHNSKKWTCSETLAHIRCYIHSGIPRDSVRINGLLDELIGAYPRFAARDMASGFQLMGCMVQLAETVHRMQDLVAPLADYAQDVLSAYEPTALSKLWSALQQPHIRGITKSVLAHLFRDSELDCYSRQLGKISPAAVDTALQMYESMLLYNSIACSDILSDSARYRFVCLSVATLLSDTQRLNRHMVWLRQTPKLLNEAALSIAAYFNKTNPGKVADWWEIVILNCGGNLTEICRNLSRSGEASLELIEQLLAIRVEKKRCCDAEILQAFAESAGILGVSTASGIRLFTAWIQVAKPAEYIKIIRVAQNCRLSGNTQKHIFAMLDRLLPTDLDQPEAESLLNGMRAWGTKLEAISYAVTLTDFKNALKQSGKPDRAMAASERLLSAKLAPRADLMGSRFLQDVCKAAQKMNSGELHLHMLCAFIFPEDGQKAFARYVDEYLKSVLSGYGAFHTLDGMVTLATAVTYAYQVPGRSKRYVEAVQELAEKRMIRLFADYYKPRMQEQVHKLNKCPAEVREKLASLLKSASKLAPPQPEGFLGNFFGRP